MKKISSDSKDTLLEVSNDAASKQVLTVPNSEVVISVKNETSIETSQSQSVGRAAGRYTAGAPSVV